MFLLLYCDTNERSSYDTLFLGPLLWAAFEALFVMHTRIDLVFIMQCIVLTAFV